MYTLGDAFASIVKPIKQYTKLFVTAFMLAKFNLIEPKHLQIISVWKLQKPVGALLFLMLAQGCFRAELVLVNLAGKTWIDSNNAMPPAETRKHLALYKY